MQIPAAFPSYCLHPSAAESLGSGAWRLSALTGLWSADQGPHPDPAMSRELFLSTSHATWCLEFYFCISFSLERFPPGWPLLINHLVGEAAAGLLSPPSTPLTMPLYAPFSSLGSSLSGNSSHPLVNYLLHRSTPNSSTETLSGLLEAVPQLEGPGRGLSV